MSELVAAAADFERQMRLGTLEITAALALFAALAARPRIRPSADIGALVPMQVRLQIFQGTSRRFADVRPPVELGRNRGAGVFLRDPEVSRRHARLETHNGVVYLADLGSSNGTFLNGRRVTETLEICDGDEIDVGTTRLIVASVRPA